MTLTFELRRQYGRLRFFPACLSSRALCAVAGYQCLKAPDLQTLEGGGFTIQVNHERVENIDWRPRESAE